MPLLWRSLTVAAPLVAGAAGLVYFGPGTGSRRDPDSKSPSIALGLRDRQSATGEEPERRRQILMQRFAVKLRAVQNLLAGRLTLLQAAAQFRDAEKTQPITRGPGIAATGPADGEGLCRKVIVLAKGWMLENVPAQAGAEIARLEAELEQHRGADGTVRLPE
jgi:hypothetical protein